MVCVHLSDSGLRSTSNGNEEAHLTLIHSTHTLPLTQGHCLSPSKGRGQGCDPGKFLPSGAYGSPKRDGQ